MIAQRLITLRKRAGLTQAQLAKQLHITPSALGNYEQGRRLPSVEMLVEMADFFHISLDYLITGKECDRENTADVNTTCPCKTCYWSAK